MQAKKVPQVRRGDPVSLEEAVMELLPETGSVEVQRDTPGREHVTHAHPTDETLLIVKGSITFSYGDRKATCTSGDRLLLPNGTEHSSVAGDQGSLYIIALDTLAGCDPRPQGLPTTYSARSISATNKEVLDV